MKILIIPQELVQGLKIFIKIAIARVRAWVLPAILLAVRAFQVQVALAHRLKVKFESC